MIIVVATHGQPLMTTTNEYFAICLAFFASLLKTAVSPSLKYPICGLRSEERICIELAKGYGFFSIQGARMYHYILLLQSTNHSVPKLSKFLIDWNRCLWSESSASGPKFFLLKLYTFY